MQRLLEIFVLLFGLICIGIALIHIACGPSAILGSMPVNASMDSDNRFHATLFLGFGGALIWCSRILGERRAAFGWLLIVFFLGGVARIISAAQVGMPNILLQLLWALELGLPPMLWWWHRSVYARVN